MINFDDITNENNKEHGEKWPYTPDHPCSNTMDDVYEKINEYNLRRKRKILIVFDEMIADVMGNKKFQAIFNELLIRCRKLNISVVFITQSCFFVPEDVRLSLTHYLIIKINNNRELPKNCD